MVREALSRRRAQVVAAAAALIAISFGLPPPRAQAADSEGAAAVADALLWGRTMPPPETTAKLPWDIQRGLSEYRKREAAFRSGTPPRASGTR